MCEDITEIHETNNKIKHTAGLDNPHKQRLKVQKIFVKEKLAYILRQDFQRISLSDATCDLIMQTSPEVPGFLQRVPWQIL